MSQGLCWFRQVWASLCKAEKVPSIRVLSFRSRSLDVCSNFGGFPCGWADPVLVSVLGKASIAWQRETHPARRCLLEARWFGRERSSTGESVVPSPNWGINLGAVSPSPLFHFMTNPSWRADHFRPDGEVFGSEWGGNSPGLELCCTSVTGRLSRLNRPVPLRLCWSALSALLLLKDKSAVNYWTISQRANLHKQAE